VQIGDEGIAVARAPHELRSEVRRPRRVIDSLVSQRTIGSTGARRGGTCLLFSGSLLLQTVLPSPDGALAAPRPEWTRREPGCHLCG
jgi:hypothetical protein